MYQGLKKAKALDLQKIHNNRQSFDGQEINLMYKQETQLTAGSPETVQMELTPHERNRANEELLNSTFKLKKLDESTE